MGTAGGAEAGAVVPSSSGVMPAKASAFGEDAATPGAAAACETGWAALFAESVLDALLRVTPGGGVMGTIEIGLAGCPGPSSESKASGAFGPLEAAPDRWALVAELLVPGALLPVVLPGIPAAAFDGGCGVVDRAGMSLESLQGLTAPAFAGGVGLVSVGSELAGPAKPRSPGWTAGCTSNSGACPLRS